MSILKYLAVALVLMLAVSIPAQTQQADPDVAAVAPPAKSASPESLSTRLGALDSLDVMPTDVETPYQGGTRRVHLESSVFRREDPVAYAADGHRDPFRPLISDQKRDGTIQTDLLVVDGADLTGVVWAEGQYLAMVKDKEKRTFFLREGDPVYKGRVVSVTQTNIVIDISDFGEYRQVTLKVND